MWGKQNQPDLTPAGVTQQHTFLPERLHSAAGPATSPGQSVHQPPAGAGSLGKSTRIRGEIYSEEAIYLDGDMEGSIDVRNCVTIGPNGKIKATIKAKEVVVRGSVQGNVDASDRIAIMNGATIVGDVKTAGIVIEDGAYFKGGIDILRPDPPKPAASAHAVAVEPKAQTARV
jgi:cytoskeletal protein CcmA (bactofilin family)